MLILNSFISAIYPLNCKCCQISLVNGEQHFCLNCEVNFGEVEAIHREEVYQLFWGKANIEEVFIAFQFFKHEHLQNLIHTFKYRKDQLLAIHLGKVLGGVIKQPVFDVISFVPMHKSKERKRGFNQAELIAKGLGEALGMPVLSLLKRTNSTSSQTEKGVFDRFVNMENKFEILTMENSYKHVLLVDDVITTGATLVACAKVLEQLKLKVSIACLAYRGLH